MSEADRSEPDSDFPLPNMGTLGMKPELFRGLRSLGPAWRDWQERWTLESREARAGLPPASSDPQKLDETTATVSTTLEAQLTWLQANPAPDPEFTESLAAYLRLPDVLGQARARAEVLDEEHGLAAIEEAAAVIKERVTRLQTRTIQLLRGQ